MERTHQAMVVGRTRPLLETSHRALPRGSLDFDDEVHRPRQSPEVNERVSGKLSTADKVALGAGVAALASGIGAAIYSHWDDIKRFFKWGNLASGAVEDSALLLETKLDHATALCDEHLVDVDALRGAISVADLEAHKLVSVNKQLRSRLDELRAAIPTGDVKVI